jgi:hypothetical protein
MSNVPAIVKAKAIFKKVRAEPGLGLTDVEQAEAVWERSISSCGRPQIIASILIIGAIDRDATLDDLPSDGFMACLVRSPVHPASVMASSTIPITRMYGSPSHADEDIRSVPLTPYSSRASRKPSARLARTSDVTEATHKRDLRLRVIYPYELHIRAAKGMDSGLEFGGKPYCVGLGIFRRVLVPPIFILESQSDVAGAVEIV